MYRVQALEGSAVDAGSGFEPVWDGHCLGGPVSARDDPCPELLYSGMPPGCYHRLAAHTPQREEALAMLNPVETRSSHLSAPKDQLFCSTSFSQQHDSKNTKDQELREELGHRLLVSPRSYDYISGHMKIGLKAIITCSARARKQRGHSRLRWAHCMMHWRWNS